ncbi:MAG: UDP-N-acetylmuramoyl-L-alanyl-D-glutamate--2,6-diaminopimelate ligase [Mailhella sp.]|nr:UDP-N-acetylmuramoyl-L-alanyl-D-glutamate--2,6-diaminopimelate ligase [Mailhella sp.]
MTISLEELCTRLRSSSIAIRTDSRTVRPGDIFVALPPAVPGAPDRRVEYASSASSAGAGWIVVPESLLDSLTTDAIKVPCVDCREGLGRLAASLYGTDSSAMPVIAITGTNGKTTCTYLLEHLFRSAGRSAGVLGTISYRWPGHDEAAPLTTPDCLTIHASFKAMRDAGACAALMEVSSHSIDQKRIAGIPFTAVAFTNLTQDHLDYHKTLEAYFSVKARLFTDFPRDDKAMVINADDEHGRRLLEMLPSAMGFGLSAPLPGRDYLHAAVLKADTSGLLLRMRLHQGGTCTREWEMSSPLVGLHNASNLLTVSALALSIGFKPADLACFSDFMGVPGRLERIPVPSSRFAGAEGTGVFVDYAHTPDALIRVLDALRAASFSRIITVFGCGGDRDRTKRPLMGEAVASRSDIVVVTSDNPRTENPEAILDDIMPGLSSAAELHREADRKKALGLAVSMLRPGDALLVAGKGHEDYQIIGTVKHHFSDQETLRELMGC